MLPPYNFYWFRIDKKNEALMAYRRVLLVLKQDDKNMGKSITARNKHDFERFLEKKNGPKMRIDGWKTGLILLMKMFISTIQV